MEASRYKSGLVGITTITSFFDGNTLTVAWDGCLGRHQEISSGLRLSTNGGQPQSSGREQPALLHLLRLVTAGSRTAPDHGQGSLFRTLQLLMCAVIYC
jgi:hypothetical protein